MDLTFPRDIDALNLSAIGDIELILRQQWLGRDKNGLPCIKSQLCFQQYLREKKAIRNADANAQKHIEMWDALPKRLEATPSRTEKK